MSDFEQKHMLIIYHSQSSRSEKIALHCYRTAKQEVNVIIQLRRALDTDITNVIWADAILIISPENFAAVSGGMKDFFDRVFYPMQRAQCFGISYALIISAGNDGSGCERQLEKILKGIGAKKIQESIIVYGQPKFEELKSCGDLALGIATGLDLGVF